MSRILSQDIQEEKEKNPRIRNGVAKDRIISTVEPQNASREQISSGTFNGYKVHVTKEVTFNIVTSITVAPENRSCGLRWERKIAELVQHWPAAGEMPGQTTEEW